MSAFEMIWVVCTSVEDDFGLDVDLVDDYDEDDEDNDDDEMMRMIWMEVTNKDECTASPALP